MSSYDKYLETFVLSPKDRYYFETTWYRYHEIPGGPHNDKYIENCEIDYGTLMRLSQEEEDLSTKYGALLKKAIKKLTKKQRLIINMYLKGITQEDIAKSLNVTQSSINLTIFGSIIYRRKRKNEIVKLDKPIRHGGIILKLRRLMNEAGC